MKRYFILLVALVMVSISMMAQARMDVVMKNGTVKSFATKDITHVKMLNVDKNGHEYVDLGLSVYWATCNVGANAPLDYGDYYAWGETATKEDYDWSTYRWCDGSEDKMTKYLTLSDDGTVTLNPEDDVAHVKWGGSWRMPTYEEIKELCTRCWWTWEVRDGKPAYRVTGPSANSIYLPAAGYSIGRDTIYYNGAKYWSSSLNLSDIVDAYSISFSSGYIDWSCSDRYIGCPVRPVCP